MSQNFIGAGVGRDHGDAAAGGGKAAQDIALGTIVHRHDVVAGPRLAAIARTQRPSRLVPGVGLAAGNLWNQVHALKAGPGGGGGSQAIEVDITVTGINQGAFRSAGVADEPRQSARIYTGDSSQTV